MQKYKVIKSIPRIYHPRYGYTFGVDWAKDGLILAAQDFEEGSYPQRLLMWNYSSSYSNRMSQVHCPPTIEWLDYSGGSGQCDFFSVYCPWQSFESSRLSKVLLVGLGERIAEKIGLYFDWRNWNRKETLIFSAIEE